MIIFELSLPVACLAHPLEVIFVLIYPLSFTIETGIELLRNIIVRWECMGEIIDYFCDRLVIELFLRDFNLNWLNFD